MSDQAEQPASGSPEIHLSDPALPSKLTALSEIRFADTLSSILHVCAQALQEQRPQELIKYIPGVAVVITSRCTEPHSVSIISNILANPIETAYDFYLAWTVIDRVLCRLPVDSLYKFRPILFHLANASQQAHAPEEFSLVTLAKTASDMIRFVDHPKDAWAPQYKRDIMAQRSLQDRVHSAEEMRPHVPDLLGWLADPNWPLWSGCREQLARFPEESIEPIRHYLQTVSNDPEWLERMLDFVSEFVPPGPLWEQMQGDVEKQISVQRGREDEEARSFVEAAEEWLRELQKESGQGSIDT